MRMLLKIACAAVLVRAVLYVVRKERALSRVRDAELPVLEPIRPEDLNVAQNAPF